MKTTSTTRSALFALLGTLALLMPLPAAAQQADPRQSETAEEPQPDERPTDAADEPPPEGEGDVEGGEVFIPSEEISEDFAVSFPVDI